MNINRFFYAFLFLLFAGPVVAATYTVNVSCTQGFDLDGNGTYEVMVNTRSKTIAAGDTLNLTYNNCTSSFSSAYAGQEAAHYTEYCGTFSPTPPSGSGLSSSISLTYTAGTVPTGGKTTAYCASGAAPNGDHIQYLNSLSPQLTIYVTGMSASATVPGAPTIGTATAGNTQATVSFTAPASNGGSAITGYTVTSSPGGVTATGTASSITVTGLTNGTAYTFTVTATNAVGTGTASAASNSVTPATTPSAPTITGITAGNAQLSVAFTAGADGGSAITNYKYSTDGGSTFTAVSPAATTSPIVITGLTNGTTYSVQIKAVNAIGDGTATATTTGTPSTTPSAPTITGITVGSSQLSVAFTAGATGGSAITNYKYSTDGGSTFTAVSPAATTSPIVITGLTNGTTYSVQIKAVNTNGDGTATATTTGTPSTTSTTTTLGASSTTPSYGASVTFTATVAPSAATGTVTFKDGATTLGTGTISSGTATYSTSALATGSHSITAVYGGDTDYAGSTSSAVTVTVSVSTRPDPTQDLVVRAMINSQVMAAQRFTWTQIDNVSGHLQQLHGSFDLKSNQLNLRLLNVPGIDHIMIAARELIDNYDSISDTQGIQNVSDTKPTLNSLLFGEMPLGLWASGNLEAGSVSSQANSTNRFTTSGITIGLDYKVLDSLIVGAAIGYGLDRTNIDGYGSQTKSSQYSGTAYATYQPTKDWFVDAVVGYGNLSYTNNRWISTDSTLVSGDRSGHAWFGSLSASDNLALGEFKLQPYLRGDFLSARLNGYSEQGSSSYALSYDGASVNSRSTAVGVVSYYDFHLASGTLTPSVKAQYMHAYGRNINQGMYYSDLGSSGGHYLLSMSVIPQNMQSLGVDFTYKTRGGLTAGLTYTGSMGSSSYRSHALRAEIRVGF